MTPLGIRPTVDFVFKLIFGRSESADVLIDLLNAILSHASPITEVEIMNPFNEKEFDEGKLSIVDVKARDSAGRSYVIEIQTTVPQGLKSRLVYYTTILFADQMRDGMSYADIRPAICICLLTRELFPRATVAAGHTRFVLHDAEHELEFGDQLQVHIVELPKYDTQVGSVTRATALEQWVFFLENAEQCDAETLRQLLPGPAFSKATGVLEMVSRSGELRIAHDDRAKAELDQFSALKDAKAEGVLIGQIELLQNLLGDTVTERSMLDAMPADQLTRTVAELQQRLHARK